MKKIILLCLAFCIAFFLVACGSELQETPQVSTTIYTTEATTAPEPITTEQAVEMWKSKISAEMTVFDYCDIVADETCAIVSFANNGYYQNVSEWMTTGNRASWSQLKDNAISVTNYFGECAEEFGLKDYHIKLILLNDLNHDDSLLIVDNGDIVYDYMAETPDMTIGQKNALGSARSYLDYSAFSYTGLIGQLEFEGYTTEEATFAADNCGADWNEQAAKKAKSYLEYSSFSRDKLIDQLEYEGFTHEQAVYGVEANGY